MDVTLQTGNTITWGGTLDSVSPFGHNVPLTVNSGTNRLLVVVLGRDDVASDWIVKYGGVALTLAYAQPKSASVTNTVWYMENPPVGTADVFFGVSSWWGATAAITAFVLDGVDLANPVKSINQLSYGFAHPPLSLAADAIAGEVTLSFLTIFSGTPPSPVPGSGQDPLSATVDSTFSRYSRHSIKYGVSSGISNTWTEVSEQAAMVAMVINAAAGGGTPAAPSSGTGTSTGSGSGGAATAASGGTPAAPSAGTGTSTGSGSGGAATGSASGSFTSDVLGNNTGSGIPPSTYVLWTWWQGLGGATPTSLTHGSGVTNSSGILSLTGLPMGDGFLLAWTADRTAVVYQPGTVT